MQLPVVVIGAGHSGLAMSRRLTERSIDHVVIERGEVANSWRTRTLGLAAPADAELAREASRAAADGFDPDGFMSVGDVAAVIERYAATVDAPVVDRTTVARLGPRGDGYEVVTDRGVWTCAAVGHRQRRLRGRVRSRVRGGAAGLGHIGDAARLPQPRVAARRWRARRRCVGHRRPARRGDQRLGSAGHAAGRRARPHAAHVPRARHLLVARDRRHPRRARRRGRRSRPRPPPAFTTADRHTAAAHDRPQRAARRRRPSRRPARADPRGRRPVLRGPGQRLCTRRPQARPAAATRSTMRPPTEDSTARSRRPSGSNRAALPDRL